MRPARFNTSQNFLETENDYEDHQGGQDRRAFARDQPSNPSRLDISESTINDRTLKHQDNTLNQSNENVLLYAENNLSKFKLGKTTSKTRNVNIPLMENSTQLPPISGKGSGSRNNNFGFQSNDMFQFELDPTEIE